MALPVAAGLSPAAAAGALLLGMAGAVVPDYADLESDMRRVLRHRGISHSLIFGLGVVGMAAVILRSLASIDDPAYRLHETLMMPLLLAFSLGLASHLVLDAATPSGIRPFLPISQMRVRLLPPGFRIVTGGRLDGLVQRLAGLALLIGLCYLTYEHLR